MIRKTFMIMSALMVAAMPSVASAGGPNETACTEKVGAGATTLRGTIAAGVPTIQPGVQNVDFTLRLERGGAVHFFRANVPIAVFSRPNENVLCDLLGTNSSPAAADLREAILATFGFPLTSRFIVTDKSFSKAEIQGTAAQWLCDGQFTDPNSPLNPTCAAPRGSAMADITIHVQ